MTHQKLRKQVLERDNYTCQVCLKQFSKDELGELNTHHIIPTRKEGLDSVHNLTSVCDMCHVLIELRSYKNDLPQLLTTIRMDSKVRDKLKKFGIKGETYESIIIKLMELKEAKGGKK